MPHLFQAIFCGIMGGLFSPICFLSTILGGGMAVGAKWSPNDPALSLKESLIIGSICGLSAGTSTLLFWYGLFSAFQSSFSWFFSHAAGKTLLANSSPLLWQYGLLIFLGSIPLSIIGSSLSYFLQQQ